MNTDVSSYKIYSNSHSKVGTVQGMTSTNNARPSLLSGDRDALNQPERVVETTDTRQLPCHYRQQRGTGHGQYATHCGRDPACAAVG